MRLSSNRAQASRKKTEAGFTLLEILVAVTILTIGMLAVARMQITAIQGIGQSGEGTVSLALGQEQLEQIINWDYNNGNLADNNVNNNVDLASGLDTSATASATQYDGHQATVNTPSGSYTVIWNVADSPAGSASHKQVMVIVQWTRKGKTRTRTLSCLKALAS